jgi:FGFR1 oncogene partner
MQDEPNPIDIQQEAKEVILKELEEKGVINYMRAKLKKQILDIINSKSDTFKQNIDFDYMTPLHRLNKPKELILVCQLIKEFLKFYELEYTLPIFENESNVKENIKRETLLKELKLEENKKESKPVLLMLLEDKLNRKDDIFNNQNKKNIDRYELSSKSERDSLNNDIKKMELNPTTFGSTNKSLEIAENIENKFNTCNINEAYKNENFNKLDENNLKENKAIKDNNNLNINNIPDNIKFEEIKNNPLSNSDNVNILKEEKKNMDIFQEVISEEIDKKELKEKNDDKLGDNQKSQSGQAFESTASNK